jgi:hypothetical protein
MYASFLGISGALHLNIFQQPAHQVFFSNLLVQVEIFDDNPMPVYSEGLEL